MAAAALATAIAALAEPGPDAGQTLVGVPEGLALATPAHYSFACAAAPDGAIWFSEFNRRQVRRHDPSTGRTETVLGDLPGVYGLAVAGDRTVFLGQDLGDKGHPGQVIRVSPHTATPQIIIPGLTRPRQLALAPDGSLYVVCEAGSRYSGPEPCVLCWRPGGEVEPVWKGLRTPQGVAVAADGTLCVSEYGRPGETPGRVLCRRPDGAFSVLADGLWRARGLALADKGALYVTTEANRGDQGNSGLLVRLDLAGSGPPVWSLAGLDYPQFPCVDAAGRVWFVLNRDSWLAAWDLSCALRPLPSPASLPPGSLLAVAGGELVPAGTEPRLRLEVAGHVLEGGPKLAPGSRVLRGWLRLPVEAVPLSRGELYRDRGDPEHPQPGLFAVPPVILQATAGTGTTTALAVRSHVGNRFPMTAIGTANEAAAPGFSEAPVAYLIHFEWRPAAPAGN